MTRILLVPAALVAVFALVSFVPFRSVLEVSTALAADGMPLCDAPGDQDSPSIAISSGPILWVAWRDHRRTVPSVQSDLYIANIQLPTPAPGPGPEAAHRGGPPRDVLADGTLICQSGLAGPPFVVPTDSGGVLVVWGDNRIPRGIYGLRLQANGSLYPGWAVNGRLLTADVEDIMLAVCGDGGGGAYVLRKRAPSQFGVQRVAIARITKTGAFAPGWTEQGILLASEQIVQAVDLEQDANGAVFTVRLYFDGIATDLQYTRAGRVSSTGVVAPDVNLPGWRSGGHAPGIVSGLAIPDGSGGLFAAWNDAPAPVFYGQHWSAVGATQWPDSLPAPFMDALLPDGEGGVYLVGREKQDLNHLAVQRRLAGGVVHPSWPANGFVVSEPPALAHVGASRWQSLFGNNGGVLVVWSENRGTGSGFDVRALHVRKDARIDLNWAPGGVAVCDMPGNQTNVVVYPYSAGTGLFGGDSRIIVWTDDRNQATSGLDLYWGWFFEPGWPVGVPEPTPGSTGAPTLAIRSVFPNPAVSDIHVTFAPAGEGPLRVDLVDLRGRVVRSRSVTPAGGEVRVVLPSDGLPAGLYWVRALQGRDEAHARVTILR